MSMPAKAAADDATSAALAPGGPGLPGGDLQVRRELQRGSGPDPRTFALAGIAAPIALGAPPASGRRQVEAAPELMAARGPGLPAGPPGMV